MSLETWPHSGHVKVESGMKVVTGSAIFEYPLHNKAK
jgi:hypothetical protein